MVWPPVPPPNTRSDTTARPTNLANDINLTSEAITEITDRLNDLPVFAQWGEIEVFGSGLATYNTATLTFPEPFGAKPIVLLTIQGSLSRHAVESGSETTTTCEIGVWRSSADGNPVTRRVAWLAIGVRP